MRPLFPPSSEINESLFQPQASETKPPPAGPKETPEALLDQAFSSWPVIQDQLKKEISIEDYEHIIAPIRTVPQPPDKLKLIVQDKLAYATLLDSFLEIINSCKDALGFSFLKIDVTLEETAAQEHEPTEIEKRPGELPFGNKPAAVFSKKLSRFSRLNPKYTFESFVRGPSNQFALATCQNVAENPGVNYNPLFLYGSTGLGKTHLLHAVGNYVQEHNKDKVVTYISSEQFMNEMIYCIRHNKMWDFRQKHRHCDVFMVDDIQFISGNKSATQEEFFHTFNTLYEAKKQIIVTSDLFPQEIPDIEARLKNRFQWGLVADIQPPDVEHRIAILINKAEQLGVKLSHSVAEYIATHTKRNVRELEGALHRIAAFAALQGRPVDRSLAAETFQSFNNNQGKKLEVDVIQKVVAEHFKLRVCDLRSKKRKKTITQPRQIAMYLARSFTSSSYPELGIHFGGKDHTTILHAVKTIEKKKDADPDLKAHIATISQQLEQMY